MKGPLFYSKILLFGEYGIIKDSKGLSIPYNFYNGALKVSEEPTAKAKESNEHLRRFATYLNTLQKENPELVRFDIASLEADIEKGLISYKSPVASALIGKEKGDFVSVSTPKGEKSYEVIKIIYK